MGSLHNGVMSGFVCRLCSKMNRHVLLIYSDEGKKLGIAKKINKYLPVEINENDQLPKTACKQCVERLERHHNLLSKIMRTAKEIDDLTEKHKKKDNQPDSISDSSSSDESDVSVNKSRENV